MRIFTILLIGITLFTGLKAQEKAMLYSHYTFNGMAINPAYAGSHDMLSVSLSHRSQWMGFEGAPSYNILGVHTPFKNTKMGLGFLVMNESIGLRKYTGFYLNYAHRLNLGRGILALGLKAGLGTGSFDKIDLGDDIVFSENANGYLLPNFGVGVYYYTKKFYAGLSIPLLLGYRTNKSGDVIAYHDFNKYAYYLTTGVNIDIAQNWQVQPSGLVEYDKAGGVIADIGLGLLYKEIIRVGTSYRSKRAIVMLLDYKITYQLKVGIAYDYGISELNSYNRNSFEIALEYNFGYRIKASNPTIF
jgi:type IX secretion system PorP/SprF family membrane protein